MRLKRLFEGGNAMKLLIISSVGELGGGAESMLYELVFSIKEEIELEVLFMKDGKLKEAVENLNIRTHYLEIPRMKNGVGVVIWMTKYNQLLKKIKPTFVLNWMPKAHLFTALPNYFAKKPTYWWQHGVPNPPNFFDKITPKLPAKKIGSSSTIAKLAQEKLTDKPVFCTFPGSDIAKHAPDVKSREAIREKYGIDEETIVLGNIGRIQSWKRQDILIEALELLIKQNKKVKLLMVGGNLYNLDNEYERKINQLIIEKGLSEYIIMTGNQFNVAPFYDAMDIYVHTAKGEPFGIVMVEAMLHAKPVVAIKSPGSIEIVKEKETGLLVNSDSPDMVTNKIEALIEKGDFHSMGLKGRERAISLFSNKLMGQKILTEIMPYKEANDYKKVVF